MAEKKNKLGVKNSLVNNINAHKKKGDSKPKSKSTIDKKKYSKMEEGWDEKKTVPETVKKKSSVKTGPKKAKSTARKKAGK